MPRRVFGWNADLTGTERTSVNTNCRFASFVLISVSPALALAQDAGQAQPAAPAKLDAKAVDTTVDPAAEKLIAASKEAVKKVRDLSYKVKQRGDMGMGETASQGVVSISIPTTSSE